MTVQGSDRDHDGSVRETAVYQQFQRDLRWAPLFNARHDLGTDLYVQARDSANYDRGLLLAVQVKTGSSYFDEPATDVDGRDGWWHREADYSHFEAWVRHGLPHLLALHSLDTGLSHWVHVRKDNVEPTGDGCKIFVPAAQKINRDSAETLFTVAATQRSSITFEGSAWAAGASIVPPASRFRFALVTPRLLAPSPEVGKESYEPEEALALLCAGRVDLYFHHLDGSKLPEPEKMRRHRDWRWRFVHEFSELLFGESSFLPKRIFEKAKRPHMIATATVVQAWQLWVTEGPAKAEAEISKYIDRVDPVDRAWLHAHRARLRADLGDIESARQDAAEAQLQILGERDDPTCSAINSAATWLLFQTASLHSRAVESAVTANDTLASWWRSQTMVTGLAAIAESNFREWSDERSVRIGNSDTPHMKLRAVELMARFSAHDGAWRSASSRIAKYELVSGQKTQDTARVTVLRTLPPDLWWLVAGGVVAVSGSGLVLSSPV